MPGRIQSGILKSNGPMVNKFEKFDKLKYFGCTSLINNLSK